MSTEAAQVYKKLKIGDYIYMPYFKEYGTVKKVNGLSVEVMLNNRQYVQTSRKTVQFINRKETSMPKKSKVKAPEELHISINIVGSGYMRKAAVMAEKGDLCYLRTFDHIEGQTDWNEQVKAAMDGLEAVIAVPPPDIKIKDKPKTEAKPSVKTVEVPKGYIGWELPDTDMPWEEYPAFYADPSKPLIKLVPPITTSNDEFLAAKIIADEKKAKEAKVQNKSLLDAPIQKLDLSPTPKPQVQKALF